MEKLMSDRTDNKFVMWINSSDDQDLELSLVINLFSSWQRDGGDTFTSQANGGRRAFLVFAASPLPSTQNNSYAKWHIWDCTLCYPLGVHEVILFAFKGLSSVPGIEQVLYNEYASSCISENGLGL